MTYNQDITLDLNTNTSYVVIGAKQFDNGRTITATILSNGQLYSIDSGTTVSYRVRKPNGGGSWNDAEIINNKVVITLTSTDLSISGRCLADILFTIGTERVSTISFIIDVAVAPSIVNPVLQSEAFDYLYKVIDEANNVIESAQAWAEGKRGTEDVLGDDSYSISNTGNITATMSDFTKFKQNIYPVKIGNIATYIFTYSGDGWIYDYDYEHVDLSDFGISVSGTASNYDTITVIATIADPAWHNNAKYYMDQSASVSYIEASISAINASIGTINSSIIALQTNAATASESIGTLWSMAAAASSSISVIWTGLSSAENDIITLQSNVAAASASLVDLQSNIITLSSSIDNAAESIASNAQDITSAKASISTLNSQMTTANTSIGTLKTQMTAASNSISTVQNQLNNIGFYSHADWIAASNTSGRPQLTNQVSVPAGQYIIIAHAPAATTSFLAQLNGAVYADYWNVLGRDSFIFYREFSSNTPIYLRAATQASIQFSDYENNPYAGLDIIKIK